jgi:hypothetical protein
MSATHDGYLLIADITGYTQYLNESELEHAQQTLKALLELLIAHTRPPLVISRLAGDAVLSYGLRTGFLHGQTFLELIESTYVAFRKAIELMVLNNTCQCTACANVHNLDLKFFVHYGQFAVQRIDNHDELVGSDVNRVHRLLKNTVTARTGMRAYALYTDPAIKQLGLEDMSAVLTPHTESYEHLGEIKCWLQDMQIVWQQRREAARLHIPANQVALKLETEINMRPELVWDYLILPEFRRILLASDPPPAGRADVEHLDHGRIGPGSIYQCYHGDKLLPLTILEWQPFERIVTHIRLPIPLGNTFAYIDFQLRPTPAGTCLSQVISKASGPWLGRAFARVALAATAKQGQRDLDEFKRQIEAHLAEQRALGSAPAIAAAEVAVAAAAGLKGNNTVNP